MKTRRRETPLYAVNDAPPTCWERMREPVLTVAKWAGVVASGPASALVVIATMRMLAWASGIGFGDGLNLFAFVLALLVQVMVWVFVGLAVAEP